MGLNREGQFNMTTDQWRSNQGNLSKDAGEPFRRACVMIIDYVEQLEISDKEVARHLNELRYLDRHSPYQTAGVQRTRHPSRR